MPAALDGGALKGGAPRVVWFTSESDPSVVSARSVAQDLHCQRQAVHLVWNPFGGDIVQMISLTRAACLLGGTAGGEGRICAQIMVVGNSYDPFTDSPMFGLEKIMSWLDSWHVPRRWPAGPPLPPPLSYNSARDRRTWARGGHFGSSQVPGTTRLDPGAIDIWRILGDEEQTGDLPAPWPATAADQASQPAPATGAYAETGSRQGVGDEDRGEGGQGRRQRQGLDQRPGGQEPGSGAGEPSPGRTAAPSHANGRASRVATAESLDPMIETQIHAPAARQASMAVPAPIAAPVPARASIPS